MISTLIFPGLMLLLSGILGLLLRRSMISVLLSLNTAMLGAALLLVGSSAGGPQGQASAFVIACVTLLVSIAGGAMSVAVYRRKGSLNIDEQRELRG
ncbi:MAG: hypothetical protein GY822_31005 [Deltaproteobacteria bacterium]|nr:hypothetical protein [Deltaproteobacteria bacterium]